MKVEETAKNLVKAVMDMFDLGAYAISADDGLYQDQRRIEVQLPYRVFNELFHEQVITKPWNNQVYPYIKKTRVNDVLFFCLLDTAKAEAEGLIKKKKDGDKRQ